MRTLVAAFFGILFGAIFTTFAAYAWSGPPGSPTTCPSGSPGCDAPINVGTGTQVKPGNLSVNAFTATQNSLFYGSIGVGSSNAPSYTLDVTGTQRTTGAVTLGSTLDVTGNVTAAGYFHSSDASLKSNIKTAPGLILINQLRGVTFDWKKDGTPSAGVIAQEVERVMPRAVHTDATTGLKSVDYDQLIAPLIEAIKEQQAEVESLKHDIEVLKAQH